MAGQDVQKLQQDIQVLEAKVKDMTENIDVITQNITEYLTNSVNMTSRFYDIFLNKTPMYVTMDMYNDQNELVSVTVPNRAQDIYESGESAVTSVNEQTGAVVLTVDNIAGAQRTLVSGTNLKTVNGNSLLASGNLTVPQIVGYTPVNKAGDTMTGNFQVSLADPRILIQSTGVDNTVDPVDTIKPQISFIDDNRAYTGGMEKYYTSDGKRYVRIYSSNKPQSAWANLDIGFDSAGNIFTAAPTPPANSDNTSIATTEWVHDTIQAYPDNASIKLNSSNKMRAEGYIDANDNTTVLKSWTGTKAEYDALVTEGEVDSDTFYNVVDDVDAVSSMLEILYPVGSIYIGVMDTCPLVTLGIGTWTLVAANRVLQGAGNYLPGATVEAGLPNITGALNDGYKSESGSAGTGCLSAVNIGVHNIGSGSGWQTTNISFDASRSNSIYGNSDTVQPPAFIVNIWQRVA